MPLRVNSPKRVIIMKIICSFEKMRKARITCYMSHDSGFDAKAILHILLYTTDGKESV